MQKLMRAAVAAAFLGTAALVPNQASAVIVKAPPAAGHGSAPGFAGAIIGVATLLAIYDFTRRTTCTGDWLNLGGPGFDSKITPTMNVLPPACGASGKKRKH
jgi:hypothetical protein